MMGEERGRIFYRDTLDKLGMTELATPDDNARFGEELISHGGVLSSIGRSIKIHAILHGARPNQARAAANAEL